MRILQKVFFNGAVVSNEWSTFGKLQTLLQESGLLPTQFVALCNAFGIEISNATLSRAVKAGRFNNHQTDEMLRPLVLKLEDLVQRAAPFQVSFEDAENMKLVLDIIDLGVDIQVSAPVAVENKQ